MKLSLGPQVMLRGLVLLSLMQLLIGCLQTRSDVRENEEKQVLQKQVSTLQHHSADINVRFQEIDEDLRKLSGRIEVVESKVNSGSSKGEKADLAQDAKLKEISDRMLVYQESIAKLEAGLSELSQQMAQLVAQAARPAPKDDAGQDSAKGPHAQAEEQFDKKLWKDAVLNFEKYRKSNPNGRHFAAATYKIGVCFQELGDIEAAKAFYDEVILKFPRSQDAERAKTRLKSLKKK